MPQLEVLERLKNDQRFILRQPTPFFKRGAVGAWVTTIKCPLPRITNNTWTSYHVDFVPYTLKIPHRWSQCHSPSLKLTAVQSHSDTGGSPSGARESEQGNLLPLQRHLPLYSLQSLFSPLAGHDYKLHFCKRRADVSSQA